MESSIEVLDGQSASENQDTPLVLVVEDNEWVQQYVRGLLKKHYRVKHAGDGIEALKLIAEETPDLVISDIMMPGMDGYELFENLQNDPELARVPVIMLTAMDSEDYKLKGLELGAYDYITKPFNPKELLARSRNLIKLRIQEKQLREFKEELENKVKLQVDVILAERLRFEKELVSAKRTAEASDRLKSIIMENISHEIRTPITAILGFSKILGEHVDGEHKHFADYIERNGNRLLDTITSILDFSQMDSETFQLDRQPVEVCSVIHEMVDHVMTEAAGEQLAVKVSCDDELCYAYLDPNALRTILKNLFANAVKFTNEGSVTVNARNDGEKVSIEIRDTGVGMSQEFMGDLFDAFRQESSGTGRTYEGIGLGLTVTRRLVQLMDGDIEVESSKGKGSAFTVRFPASRRGENSRDADIASFLQKSVGGRDIS